MSIGAKLALTAHAEVLTAADAAVASALRSAWRKIPPLTERDELNDAREFTAHLAELGFRITRV